MIGTLKYQVNIEKENMIYLLNNKVKINVILYHIILKLELAMWLNIIVIMKEAEDLKSSFIEYIPDIPVRIRDVIIKQPFFILEKGLNLYILNQPFETITRMARQTLNNELVRVIIFNLENNMIQVTF